MENGKEFQEDLGYTHTPINITETGLSLDLIIQKHKEMSTEVICSICLAMVFDPIMCAKCENLFCRSCINAVLKKSCKCPNKCIFEEKQVGRVLKNLLNKFELQCYYFKNGCPSIIIYGEYQKHCTNCEYGDFKCNTDKCGFIGTKKAIITHVSICPLKLLLCRYCKMKIYQKDYVGHFKECEVKMVNCVFCKHSYQNKNLEKHMKDDCEFIEISCSKCNSKFIKKDYIKHDKVDCLEHQVKYWKSKANELDSEIETLKKQLVDANKKNQRYINFSAKLLENTANSKNALESMGEENEDITTSMLARINNNSNNMHNGSISLANYNGKSSNSNSNHYNALMSIIPMSSSLQSQSSSLVSISNKYKTESIITKNTLSGLVYSIIDLSSYISGLICCDNYNSILFFQLPQMENIFSLEGHNSYILNLIHLKSYKKNYIASASQDNSIKVWDIALRQCQRTYSGHSNWVTSLCSFAFDSKYLISISYDHTLRIWDLSLYGNESNVKTIDNIYGKLCGNTIHYNKALIAYGNNDHNIIMYDFQKDSSIMELKGHSDLVNYYADLGSYNRNYIASGADDATVKVWNLLTGNMIASFHGHSKCINLLLHLHNFDDNSIIASGSDDMTIRLWSLINFQCVTLLTYNSYVKSMLYIKNDIYKDCFLVHGQKNIIEYMKIIKN